MDPLILAGALIALTIVVVSALTYLNLPGRSSGPPPPLSEEAQLAQSWTDDVMAMAQARLGERASLERVDLRRFRVRWPGGPSDGLVADTSRVLMAREVHPQRAEALAEGFVQGLMDAALPLSALEWSRAQRRVMPSICADGALPSPDAVAFELGHGLSVTLVLPGPQPRPITAEVADAWGVSLERVRRAALENLSGLTERVPLRGIADTGTNALYIYESRDGYDAARILLDEQWRALAQRHQGTLRVAIPSQDFLIAFTDGNPEHVEQIRARVFHDWMHEGDLRLTWKLFRVTSEEGLIPEEVTLH